MYTIEKNIKHEIEVNKSKFITNLYTVNNLDDVKMYLNTVKNEYKGATHYCYAYIIDGNIKCSDDKEPSGTAGNPILNILTQHKLNRILCIVVRYFGGTKLGTGGLIRAYSTSCNEALAKTKIVKLKDAYKIRIKFNYNDIEQINFILKDDKITYKEFNETVIYEAIIEKDDISKLDKYKYEIIENMIIN